MRILVTRPAEQSEAFVLLLKQAGHEEVRLPCIGIRHLPASDHSLDWGNFGALIFTSSNAVNGAHQQYPLPWDVGNAAVLAIGPATAEALENHDQPVAEPPIAPFNSESLLKSATLKCKDLQQVAIIKGKNGRDYLQKSLEKRGLKVHTLDTYERYVPEYAASELDTLFLNSPVDIVTITSNEILHNLATLAGAQHREQLLRLPLVVSSSRAADLAQELGFRNTIAVADTPGNLGLMKAITALETI